MLEVLASLVLVCVCLQIFFFLECMSSHKQKHERLLRKSSDPEKGNSSDSQNFRSKMFRKMKTKDENKNKKKLDKKNKDLVKSRSSDSIFSLSSSTITSSVVEPMSFIAKIRYQSCKKPKPKAHCCHVRSAKDFINNLVKAEKGLSKYRYKYNDKSSETFRSAEPVDDGLICLPYSNQRSYSEGDVTFKLKKEYQTSSSPIDLSKVSDQDLNDPAILSLSSVTSSDRQQDHASVTLEPEIDHSYVNEVLPVAELTSRRSSLPTSDYLSSLPVSNIPLEIDFFSMTSEFYRREPEEVYDEVELRGFRKIQATDEMDLNHPSSCEEDVVSSTKSNSPVNLIKTISKILNKALLKEENALPVEENKAQNDTLDFGPNDKHLDLNPSNWYSDSTNESEIHSKRINLSNGKGFSKEEEQIGKLKSFHQKKKFDFVFPLNDTNGCLLQDATCNSAGSLHRIGDSIQSSSLTLHHFDSYSQIDFKKPNFRLDIETFRPNINTKRSFSNPENGRSKKIHRKKLEKRTSVSLESINKSEHFFENFRTKNKQDARTFNEKKVFTNFKDFQDNDNLMQIQDLPINNDEISVSEPNESINIQKQNSMYNQNYRKASTSLININLSTSLMNINLSTSTEQIVDCKKGKLQFLDLHSSFAHHSLDGSQRELMEVESLTRSYESIIEHQLDMRSKIDRKSVSKSVSIDASTSTIDICDNQNLICENSLYSSNSDDDNNNIRTFEDNILEKPSDSFEPAVLTNVVSECNAIIEIKAQIHQSDTTSLNGQSESNSCCGTNSSDESVSELSSASDIPFAEDSKSLDNQSHYEEIPEDYKNARRDEREKKLLQGLDDLIAGVPAPDYETCDTPKDVHGDLSRSVLTPPPLPARGYCPPISQEYDDDQSIKSSVCRQSIVSSSADAPHKVLVRTNSVTNSPRPQKNLSSSSQHHKVLSKSISEPRTTSITPQKRSSDPPPPPPPPPKGFSSSPNDDRDSESYYSSSSDEGKPRVERTQSLPEGSDQSDASSTSGKSSKGLSFIPPRFPSMAAGQGLIKPSEYLRSLVDPSEVGPPDIGSLPSIPESREDDLPIPPPPPPAPMPLVIPTVVSVTANSGSTLTRSPSSITNSSKPVMPSISVTDLQSVQLRKTETKVVKTNSVPLKIHNGDPEFTLQRHDVIAELKMGVDIDGIKKLKTEKAKEEIVIVQKEKEELKKHFNAEKFVEQVPDIDPTGNPIPLWKRQMLAKKAAEKAKKEAEEQKLRELEERRLQCIPPWKRQLMAKKEIERQRNPSYVPKVEEIKRIKMGQSLSSDCHDIKLQQKNDKKPIILHHPAKEVEIIEKNCEINQSTSVTQPISSSNQPEENENVDIHPVPWRAVLKKTNCNVIKRGNERNMKRY